MKNWLFCACALYTYTQKTQSPFAHSSFTRFFKKKKTHYYSHIDQSNHKHEILKTSYDITYTTQSDVYQW